MPEINGLDVSKEILSINPHQRIIFASSYVNDELKELFQMFGLQCRVFAKLLT